MKCILILSKTYINLLEITENISILTCLAISYKYVGYAYVLCNTFFDIHVMHTNIHSKTPQ